MLLRLAFVALLSGSFAVPRIFQHVNSAFAATTKKKSGLKKRSEYTAEQREKLLENARKLCKKKYGAPSSVYRIDYARNIVWCRET